MTHSDMFWLSGSAISYTPGVNQKESDNHRNAFEYIAVVVWHPCLNQLTSVLQFKS